MTTELTESVHRPGRLGDPKMQMRDDPRSDPQMVAALAPAGLDVPPDPMPVPLDGPREHLLALCAAMEEQMEQLFATFSDGLEPIAGVTTETVTIPGPDGNEITIYVHRPTDVDGPLPGIVHFHGGGMVLLEAAGPAYRRWRDALAASGLVVFGVEFRNGAGKHGPHAFPAGLDDCVAATRWALANASELGISKVVLSGESGGGNLSLSVALRANREGWANELAGVYALCPFIHGNWSVPGTDLPSLHENEGYFLSADMMATLAVVYDPAGENAGDPTCWPLRASAADVAGLPPHVISVNEVDPLRDEGLTYQRLLRANGVRAVGRVVAGTCHGGDVLLPAALPEANAATVRDIKGFADSL